MSFAANITTALERIGGDIKTIWTLLNGKAADLSALNTTAKGTLVAAINEVKATADAAGSGTGDMDAATYDAAAIEEQLVGLTATQTLTNKTLTSPVVTTPALTLENGASFTTTVAARLGMETTNGKLIAGDGSAALAFAPLGDAGTSAHRTWSASKINAELSALETSVVDSITNGAGAAYDTLKELEDEIVGNDSAIASILTAQGLRVRVDAVQGFNAAQQLQGCENLGLGDPTTDFDAAYVAARDAV